VVGALRAPTNKLIKLSSLLYSTLETSVLT
jgi:hypothetical protein